MAWLEYKKIIRNSGISLAYSLGAKHCGPFARRVIALHDVENKKQFRQKIMWLKDNFKVISLSEILSSQKFDEDVAAITFDDGYACWYYNAAPVLDELNLPATFFTCSSLVRSSISWKQRLIKDVMHRTRSVTAISEAQLTELSLSSLFEVGGHTRNHKNLGDDAALSVMRREVFSDRLRLEDVIGKRVRFFAYPYGRAPNISALASRVVSESGYEAAFSIIPGNISNSSNRLCVPRDSLPLGGSDRLWNSWLKGGYDWFNKEELSLATSCVSRSL